MTDHYFEFSSPVKLVAGFRALEHIPFELETRGATRPLIVSDKGVVAAGLVEVVMAAVRAEGGNVGPVFDDVPPDSSMEAVEAGARVYLESGCDAIIAVGGGSVMDTAKAMNIMATEGGGDPRRFAGYNNLTHRLKPFVAIPTTAGTGSEVTAISVIKDREAGSKTFFFSQFLLPDVAVLDPRMTLKLPPMITAATAMDALTHAVEAYTCLGKNPLSDAYAEAAIRRISRWMVPVLENPQDGDGRLALAEAAAMAGIAFSNSPVGLVHALAHTVGAMYGIHHGAANSIFLPAVLRFNLPRCRDQIGDLLLYLAGADVYAGTSVDRRPEEAIGRIEELKEKAHALCGLPRTLAETGKVSRDALPEVATRSLDDGTMVMNPRDVTYEQALEVLEAAWD
ncbi:MAG: iron-containing alcohol dehydrogenase [Gammaproteobacteria bacterium]|jgi:alcohol dehydrogenase|nr:MAG: alcohol dehydrogenase [Gammaproteobacteria bacterium SG8_31]